MFMHYKTTLLVQFFLESIIGLTFFKNICMCTAILMVSLFFYSPLWKHIPAKRNFAPLTISISQCAHFGNFFCPFLSGAQSNCTAWAAFSLFCCLCTTLHLICIDATVPHQPRCILTSASSGKPLTYIVSTFMTISVLLLRLLRIRNVFPNWKELPKTNSVPLCTHKKVTCGQTSEVALVNTLL